MALILDEQLVFKAMVTFLTTLHEQLGWDNLPGLLGSMALIDGVPLDPAIEDDWKTAVDQTLADLRSSGAVEGLTVQQAYSAVQHFLDKRFFKEGKTDVGKVLKELQPVDLLSVQTDFKVAWADSIAFGVDPTKSIKAVVVQDDVAYETHTKPRETS
ncbi:hypothetical protein [Dyella japonica]|uniref:Uncharacterized protein n=1 Tax=Dyella japonica TaxID=231455 RepID=A0ABV2JXY5_9GAMM